MEYYQSAVKQYGMALLFGILALFLVNGCVARQAEKAPVDDALQETAVAQNTGSQRVVDKISVNGETGQVNIWIEANQTLEYTSIKQSFPFAVSVYLPETVLANGIVPAQSSDSRIGGIKAGYADEEQTTAKIDILLTRDMPYSVVEEGNKLGIILQDDSTTNADAVASGTGLTASGMDDVTNQVTVTETEALTIPGGLAQLTNIEFNTNATGQSDIHVETTHPVRYDTRQVNADTLYLTLYNTNIPIHHQRPLLTRYFNSAVERVDPQPYPGKNADTLINIKIREQVPFRVVQNRQGIHLSFDPSAVQPPEFTKAKKIVRSGSRTVDVREVNATASEINGPAIHTDEAGGMGGYSDPVLGLGNGPYTGEKIKLDFFDTDIKNVFRILRSVSGLNFAIDQDVQGKVTLSLGEAVPWDQVLDLVLKMNGLGKKMEGNVVRIATAGTLQNEEKMRQDAIAARKKSIEQEQAMEPLFTEYIPINYSDAKTDIEPHVTKILTPERGTISVDQRTNMIIITDTQKKIDQANDLIYRLDKVTPQIMIEAKVVEVTKEFSRSFGINWNLSNASSVTSGFIDDYSVSINDSTNVGISGDFSFFGLFGSSVSALNAQLEASEEQGDVKIVSSPRILTLDNKKAMIKQGEEYGYLERDDSGGSSIAYKDIDLLLEVTPHVTPDNRISMTVRLTKNDVASFNSDGSPNLATNEAETELLVNNNDTVVIGGVIKTTQSKDNDGVPFLSGIPGLGYLFGSKAETDDRNELLIFLTPSIVQLKQKRAITK